MNKAILCSTLLISICTCCKNPSSEQIKDSSAQIKIITEMIESVNAKDADKYVHGFAKDAKVFVESEMKVDGRAALKANRAKHFENHPKVRSEIQHLVEIDNKVILHDKVWLDESDKMGQDIVEIFTFENGEVAKVDVIQPQDLFR